MKILKTKKQVFDYIKRKYLIMGKTKSILIKGSSVNSDLREFSDIDVEVYQEEKRKPEYEIVLVGGNLVLITTYFYKPGKKLKSNLKNSLLIHGDYYEPIENQGDYTEEERKVRDNQLFLDFLFKYLRTKNPKYLSSVDKYSKLK